MRTPTFWVSAIGSSAMKRTERAKRPAKENGEFGPVSRRGSARCLHKIDLEQLESFHAPVKWQIVAHNESELRSAASQLSILHTSVHARLEV